MIVYLVAMIAILAVAAVVVGLVMVGMEGRGEDRLPPWLANKLHRAAKHLNGEVDPPAAFTQVMERRRHRRDHTHSGT